LHLGVLILILIIRCSAGETEGQIDRSLWPREVDPITWASVVQISLNYPHIVVVNKPACH
jgi:hypothetical protein